MAFAQREPARPADHERRELFIGELAQRDLRFADAPLPPDEAAKEKAAGSARLRNLKPMLKR